MTNRINTYVGGMIAYMVAKNIDLDEKKIEQLRTRMSNVLMAGIASWCAACGASSKALREILTDKPEYFKELISEETIASSVGTVNIEALKGVTAWCVGCGAGAKQMPEIGGMPVAQIDKIMEDVIKILEG